MKVGRSALLLLAQFERQVRAIDTMPEMNNAIDSSYVARYLGRN